MISPLLFIPVGLVVIATITEIVLKAIDDWKVMHPDISHLNFEPKRYRTRRNYCG